MAEEVKKQKLDMEGLEQAEDTFLDDSDDDSSIQSLYSYYRFPNENPTSVRFKGKKSIFVKSVETLKNLLKRGEGSIVNDVSVEVLDIREMQHGIEYDIKCSKNQDKGVSVLKIYGPNPKKGCTVMVCKSREYDNKFVSILSKDVIKHLIDTFEATDEWKTLKFSPFKKPSCSICKKSFCNEKNLKTHIKKYRTNSSVFKCDICDFTCDDENNLKAHKEKIHKDDISIKCEVCYVTFESENALKTHVLEKHQKDSIIKCERCDYTVNNEKDMFDHNQHVHQITGGEQEEEDIRMEIDGHDSNAKAKDNDEEVQILKERIKTLLTEHENKVNKIIKLNETNKKRLEKEDLRKSNEINKLKEENAEVLEKLGLMQCKWMLS